MTLSSPFDVINQIKLKDTGVEEEEETEKKEEPDTNQETPEKGE